MLVEIRSDRFRTNKIDFHKGLNIVLGDENATNSIGKSILLMVIDFAFGGGSLLEYNKDLVEELGDHDYYFSFEFDKDVYRFRRGTYEPDLVYKCDEGYEPTATISIEEYTAFLKAAYGIEMEDMSFRALVGLYSRVWGKDNLNVHKPLHVVQNQSGGECVNNLIKTFGQYASIKELTEQLKGKEEERSALTNAFKKRIIPKIGKREYEANEARIAAMEREINDIKTHLAKYATNIAELVNREVLELKIQKDGLLSNKLKLESKLARIRRNISDNRYIRSRHFDGLVKFFPDINKDRLSSVEEFHSGLVKVLKSELREAENELNKQKVQVDNEILAVESKMAGILASVDQPTIVVDRVYDLANALRNARDENEHFENDTALKSEVQSLKERLSDEKIKVIGLIQKTINDGIRRIVTSVYGPQRKSPSILIKENGYSYEVFEDTGTGTAYASLIVLDLTVFRATILPFVAHDSLLFKNIENDSVARLLQVYLGTEKQSFVAIDEIDKYGRDTASMLRDRSVIQLDDDNVLFIKDWRGKREKKQ
ncbi:MAG: hypothetical protein A4E65_03819 [Syntrophorhabdus sp. PtaU1.Bin153]|nr:MAG: hypothetical protein A4E65_03819 [Syntrophorhabdus sp. PtaU1.Bin153]